MKISTATSVFVNYPIQDAVDEIIQAGFDGIDFWCGRPHIFRRDHPPQFLRMLRRKLDDHGVSVVSLMPAFFRYPFSLSSVVDAIRLDSVLYMRECMENAVELGAGIVLVVPTRTLFGQSVDDARSRFIDSLHQISPLAKELGIVLGLEVLNPQLTDFVKSTQDALDIIQKLGSEQVNVVLDTGHLNLSGEPVDAAIGRLGSLLVQMHIDDNDGKQQQNSVPGEGNFDFVSLIRSLRRHGYGGYLTFELGYTYTGAPVDPVRTALQRVRDLLADIPVD